MIETRQLYDETSSTYTYLLTCKQTNNAVLIDAVREQQERDTQLIQELDLNLTYIIDTHIHADHITGSSALREATGAKVIMSKPAGCACADILVDDGETINFGNGSLEVRLTPGHTNGCMSLYGHGRVFTGDALLIRACGRTDFQEGSAENLFESVHTKLFTLPDETIVYPAHDYKGRTMTTIGEEKAFNPRLKSGISKDNFVSIMNSLNLPYPRKIDEALPANQKCGDVMDFDISIEHMTDAAHIVDVRTVEEYTAGHIKGAELITLGPDFMAFLQEADKNKYYIFVCRSGNRSAHATMMAREEGFQKVQNLKGGMLEWQADGRPIEQGL